MGAAGWSDVQVKDLLSACTRPVEKAPSSQFEPDLLSGGQENREFPHWG